MCQTTSSVKTREHGLVVAGLEAVHVTVNDLLLRTHDFMLLVCCISRTTSWSCARIPAIPARACSDCSSGGSFRWWTVTTVPARPASTRISVVMPVRGSDRTRRVGCSMTSYRKAKEPAAAVRSHRLQLDVESARAPRTVLALLDETTASKHPDVTRDRLRGQVEWLRELANGRRAPRTRRVRIAWLLTTRPGRERCSGRVRLGDGLEPACACTSQRSLSPTEPRTSSGELLETSRSGPPDHESAGSPVGGHSERPALLRGPRRAPGSAGVLPGS